MRTDEEKIRKQQSDVIKQTDKAIKKLAQTKAKRHVKEPTEPVFDKILEDFSFHYAKEVVTKTMTEVLKSVKDGF